MHDLKAGTRLVEGPGGCEEQTPEVGEGGCPARVGSTTPTTLSRENRKRYFPQTKKTKSSLCDCGIKSPVHTVGYHDAILRVGGTI